MLRTQQLRLRKIFESNLTGIQGAHIRTRIEIGGFQNYGKKKEELKWLLQTDVYI